MRMLHFGNRNVGWFFLAALIGLLYSTGFDQPALAQDAVKIGLVGPTTGPVAYYGTLMQKGGLLAADEINANGGLLGGKMVPVTGDTTGTPQGAVDAATKLVSVENVSAIVGARRR